MPKCSFCQVGRAVGEFCRGGKSRPVCMACVDLVGTQVFDMSQVERCIQAIGMPVRKLEGGGGSRKAGARRGTESDVEDDDPTDIRLVFDSDDESPAAAAAAGSPTVAPASSSSSRPIIDLTLSDDDGSAPGTPSDYGAEFASSFSYDDADYDDDDTGAPVLVFVRWNQYDVITDEWRFRALVPGSWSLGHVLRYIERNYGQPGVASEGDVDVIRATPSWSAATQATIATVHDWSRAISTWADTSYNPARIALSKDMRPLPAGQPDSFDASFYGKARSNTGIVFDIVCDALDRECEVSAVPLYATWRQLLQRIYAQCPGLSNFIPYLAGRPILRSSAVGLDEISDTEQIYTTLAGYVFNPRGGIKLVFE